MNRPHNRIKQQEQKKRKQMNKIKDTKTKTLKS